MKLFSSIMAAALAFVALSSPAQATLYNFNISGDYSSNFQIDSIQTPVAGVPNSSTIFAIAAGTFTGAQSPLVYVYFFNAASGGGLGILDPSTSNILMLSDGPQLYSGTEADPDFLAGTFALTEFEGSGKYTVVISDAALAAVPESATWTMMLAGFGMIGVAIRRRAKTRSAVAYA